MSVHSVFISPTRQNELAMTAFAQRLANERNAVQTVWHDCAALDSFVSAGTAPPLDRAVMRVATVYPATHDVFAHNRFGRFAGAYFSGTESECYEFMGATAAPHLADGWSLKAR